METPNTETNWTKQIISGTENQQLDLMMKRPIVSWFSKQRKMVYRLFKVSARLGDDGWIICGFDNHQKSETVTTVAPNKLRICLRYLTPKNEWVLCEFADEISFCRAVIEYLSQPDHQTEENVNNPLFKDYSKTPSVTIKPASTLIALEPTEKQKKDIIIATTERVAGRKITEWCECCGTYGQGGPGFFGFKLAKTSKYPEEWLILRIWSAGDWLLVNNRWLSAPPNQYHIQKPLVSKYGKKTWDRFSRLVLNKKIKSFDITKKTMKIIIGSTTILISDNPEERPNHCAGAPRILKDTDDLRWAWIIAPYPWIEI